MWIVAMASLGLGGTEAAISAEPKKVFLFATEYDFFPEGLRRIRKLFDGMLKIEKLVRSLQLHEESIILLELAALLPFIQIRPTALDYMPLYL